MLSFSSGVIHRPLTRIDEMGLTPKEHKELLKLAVLQFKSLLGFQGERKVCRCRV